MSSNTFGTPNPFGSPRSAPAAAPVEEEGGKRTKVLALAGGGLAAVVLAGGAALMLTGGSDDEADLAVTAPTPSASPTEAVEAPAPLPTSVEFAGRNPFKARIVEGSSSGTGAAAASSDPAAANVTDPASSGSGDPTTSGSGDPTPSETGGGSEPEVVAVRGPVGPAGPAGPTGPAGETIIPFVSITYLGAGTADDPADLPSSWDPIGFDETPWVEEVTEDSEDAGVTTSAEPTDPATDPADPEDTVYGYFVVDIGMPDEYEVEVPVGSTFHSAPPLSWLQLMEVQPDVEGELTRAKVRLGAQPFTLTQDRPRVIYQPLESVLENFLLGLGVQPE